MRAFLWVALGAALGSNPAHAQAPGRLPLKTVAVAPSTSSASAEGFSQDTVVLLKAFRDQGYRVGAVESATSPVPGTEPYLFVSMVKADARYCLEGIVRMMRAPKPADVSFEQRIDWMDGALKRSAAECAQQFAREVKARLKKSSIE